VSSSIVVLMTSVVAERAAVPSRERAKTPVCPMAGLVNVAAAAAAV
jgi:hypothetical protein